MNCPLRRDVLRWTGGLCASMAWGARSTPAGIRIREVGFGYEDYLYRAPLKFGGVEVDRVTLLNVNCVVEAPGGRTARGFGSMPLGNVWSFPSKTMPYARTLAAMQALAERIAKVTGAYRESGHPIDINIALEPAYLKAAGEVTRALGLPDAIPKLCTLVTASPFDAAIHDAFGRLHGLNCYRTYGPEFMAHDSSRYLTPEFKGEYLNRYVLPSARPGMPLYHLVGAVDPIENSDLKTRLEDGLPNTLPEWIRYSGLTHIKIKLNGDDGKWDLERILRVDRVAAQTSNSAA